MSIDCTEPNSAAGRDTWTFSADTRCSAVAVPIGPESGSVYKNVSNEIRVSLQARRLQELSAIQHLLCGQDLSNQHRASDDEPNDRVGRCEQDACVGNSSSVESQMIGIGSDQDPAFRPGKGEERSVGGSELLRFSRS